MGGGIGPGSLARFVRAWLVRIASKFAKTISRLAIAGVHGRTRGSRGANRLAARSFFRPAAFGPYGATLAAHVRRPAADSARRAAPSAVAWAPKEIRPRRN